ncbi:MAG: MFS transporter [Verrucomicrobiota bacterium]
MTLSSKQYHVGSLSYTRRGLLVLFGWLLWGDFCFTLMEAVVPSILPLKLKALGAPNWVMAVILTTLPGILNMTVCPWVSFKSDRHRSKWGRRIPFILGTIPMLCLSLVAMGWTDEIASVTHGWLPAAWNIAPTTLVIILLAVFMVSFSFFNMFVNSVFWYLFNDVVPAEFLGRFYGFFRMVGTLAGALFNYFIFQHAETHMREIFTGAAVLYFVGFGIVCLRVKEGEYPPPPETPKGKPLERLLGEVRLFCRESYTNRFYWYFYLSQTFAAVALAVYMFYVFFYREMGLDLHQIGIIATVGSVTALAGMYVAAIYVDRWHPLRIAVYFAIFFALTTSYANWIWVAVSVPALMFFWLNMGNTVTTMFGATLNGNTALPIFMRLLPSSRYGQLCSATSIIRSVGTVIAGLLAGAYLDAVKWLCNGTDFAYRYIFAWITVWSIASAVFLYIIYRKWKGLGGDADYRAPAPWSAEGFEDMSDKNRPIKVHHRWLLLALRLFTVGFVLHLLSLPVFLVFCHQHGLTHAFWWFAWVFTPVAILTLAVWNWQVRCVRSDIATEAAGQIPRYGIPHHGVIMVMAIQGLLTLPVLWLQVGWALQLNMEKELIWFGAGAATTVAPNLLALHVLRILEKPLYGPAKAPCPTGGPSRCGGTSL